MNVAFGKMSVTNKQEESDNLSFKQCINVK